MTEVNTSTYYSKLPLRAFWLRRVVAAAGLALAAVAVVVPAVHAPAHASPVSVAASARPDAWGGGGDWPWPKGPMVSANAAAGVAGRSGAADVRVAPLNMCTNGDWPWCCGQ
jgi:hypothetical protein